MRMDESNHRVSKAIPAAAEQSKWSVNKPALIRFARSRWRVASAVIALVVLQALSASAQTPTPSSSPTNPCPTALTPSQNLIPVPVIGSSQGRLRGTIILSDEQQWMTFRVPVSAPTDSSRSQCLPQYVRMFREYGAQSTMASAPYGAYARGQYALPRPGPTLRARVGDLVQLTFINQINTLNFGNSIDRGETGRDGGCDSSSAGYPGGDKFPDCFHGSSTGNIHFHGTHTNPNTTADNVFIEVRPSLREDGKPVVTQQSVAGSFEKFFAKCEVELSKNVLKEWPRTWDDLPDDWTDKQKELLKDYDKQLEKNYGPGVRKLWPIDEKQIKQGAWPQYYIGSFPYCFRLPEYKETSWPPPPHSAHAGGAGTAELQAGDSSPARPLIMGQSPGTHWYHAHKHGSTAINVANGMTGAFIIEGKYDDQLNTWYGPNWTRNAQVLVVNQLGVTPNLVRGGAGQQDKGPDFSVNGQMKPEISMQPGEVQMWRIVNTSGRAAMFFEGLPAGFQVKQLAQDGVQFSDHNYKNRPFKNIVVAPGNRVDLLVKAPAPTCATAGGCKSNVIVKNMVDPSDLKTAQPLTLLTVNVTGTPVDPNSNGANFIPNAPTLPAFLKSISDDEIKGTKNIVFGSTPPVNPPAQPAMHTIDNKKFDGEVGEVVLLNNVEEWKVENATYGPAIAHPFHIHINPFQVTEIFNPNAQLLNPKTGKPYVDAKGNPVNDPNTNQPAVKYVFWKTKVLPGQCYLDPNDPKSWKPMTWMPATRVRPAGCVPTPNPTNMDNIWWDVFPIPSGYAPTKATTDSTGKVTKTPITYKNKDNKDQPIQIRGYFKMRSRFVDYAGFYVIHCHILAHEDRGMMTIVEVAPMRTPYSHH